MEVNLQVTEHCNYLLYINSSLAILDKQNSFRYHDSCELKTVNLPNQIRLTGKTVYFSILFNAKMKTSVLGFLSDDILPQTAMPINVSGTNGQSYYGIVNPSIKQIYFDVEIPSGIYGINTSWIIS